MTTKHEGKILVDADDAKLVGLVHGLVLAGEVLPVHGLSKSDANHGREYALLRLHETKQKADRLKVERVAVDAELETVNQKLVGAEVWTGDELEEYVESRSDKPPKSVSRDDVEGIGRWCAEIASGKVKVV